MATKEEKKGEVEDLLKCGVCLERYRRPKLLPCFHTYCQRCVETLAGAKPSFPCPACRTIVVIPPGGASNLQANFYLEKDLAKAEAEEGRKCQLCSKGKQAQFKCVQCQQLYCAPCRGLHDAIESCSQHTVLSTKDDGGKGGEGEEASVLEKKCPKHKNQLLSLFCRGCEVAMCMQCSLTTHSGHDTEDVSDTGIRARTELKEQLEVFAQREQLFSAVLTKLDDFFDDLEKEKQSVEQAIRDRSREVQELAARAQDEALQSVQLTAQSAFNTLKEQAQPVKERHVALTAKRRHVQQVLTEGDDGEAVELLASLRNETNTPSRDSVRVERSTIRHGFRSRAVKYHDVLAFIGTAQEGPLLEVRAASGEISVLKESAKARPAQPYKSEFGPVGQMVTTRGALQATEIIYSRNQRAEIRAMLVTAGDEVWVVYKPGEINLMALFDDQGNRLETLKEHFPEQLLIACDGDAVVSLYDGKWVRPGGEKGQRGLPSRSGAQLSKSASPFLYQSLYIYHFTSVASLTPELDANPTAYDAGGYGCVTFDVSADGKFYALNGGNHVYVFDKPEATVNLRLYASYRNENNAQISDVCFAAVAGEEVMVVAFPGNNTVHVVDHKDGCCFLRTLESDACPLDRPQRLATNQQGRVWVGCHGGRIVVFDM